MKATEQDGSYPRPLMCRDAWTSLDGTWAFTHDDDDVGLTRRWFDHADPGAFPQTIEVPYPPESPASGVGARDFHPIAWYRRAIPHDLVRVKGGAEPHRVLIHFGAVDHRAQVWFDGQLVADHLGGQTPFTVDVTDALDGLLDAHHDEHVIVVRAEDDPHALHQPRGKQDWRREPHGIWYERTTGIWQPVWLETVPVQHLTDVAWTFYATSAVVRGEVALAANPTGPLLLEVTLRLGDEVLADVSCVAEHQRTQLDLVVPAMRNGQDRARLLWSPEHPRLVDADVVVRDRSSGEEIDRISSYLGLREVSVGEGSFNLNGGPYYTRSVLDQGYRPKTHLASQGGDELRAEVELIKEMGFNAVRVHQKAEDPRFLFWADRLGLLVWSETAAAYEFSPQAIALLTNEWIELVQRYRSHPSVVVWVPVNESWGMQDIATVPAQQQFSQALVSLTRALDPSRPAISNEGWEHVDSDILGIHDYTVDPATLRGRYHDRQSTIDAVLTGHGPARRRPILNDAQAQRFLDGRAPLMITEFGGISLSDDDKTWGYGHAASTDEYASMLAGLFDALRASTQIVGFCYTQFMDTGLETNGLLYADGTPKLPIESIFSIVTGQQQPGTQEPHSTFGTDG